MSASTTPQRCAAEPTLSDVVIVGAGMAGLTCASRLRKEGLAVSVLEARDRIGGRLLSPDGLDLGAAWTWPHGEELVLPLAQSVGQHAFKQHAVGEALTNGPDGRPQRVLNQWDGSVRFGAGTQGICSALAAQLDVKLKAKVHKVSAAPEGGQVTVFYTGEGAAGSSEERSVSAKVVILAAPPRLLQKRVSFEPPLPAAVERAMKGTPTWMEDTMKVVATYKRAFWREEGLSGAAFPRGGGPLAQIWDNCVEDTDGRVVTAALGGFILGEDCARMAWKSEEEVEKEVLAQLAALFGDRARGLLVSVRQMNWLKEEWTNAGGATPGGGFGNHALREPLGRIVFAGTETEDFHGHMEGAIASAVRASKQAQAILASS